MVVETRGARAAGGLRPPPGRRLRRRPGQFGGAGAALKGRLCPAKRRRAPRGFAVPQSKGKKDPPRPKGGGGEGSHISFDWLA